METNINSKPILVLAFIFGLTACSSTPEVAFRDSAQPRFATWSCTSDVRLTVRNAGSGLLQISDSRGVETDLPADPPGQRERYGKTGFALVFEGREASWFISGRQPVDCRR
ncbi:MAG: hypothetical protein AAFY99_12695 [Pseudomonadota bacterium]